MASELSPVETIDAAAAANAAVPVAPKVDLAPSQPIEPVREETNFSEEERALRQQSLDVASAIEDEENAAQFQQVFDETEDALLTALEPVPLPPEQAAVLSTNGHTRKVIVFGALTLDVYI